METSERIRLLQDTPFFGAINVDSVSLLLDLSELVSHASGELFFSQGDYGDALYLLEHGSAAIFREWQGHEYVLRRVKDGDCFGELSLIDLSPRSASVRAETDCQALRISASALHQLYLRDVEQFVLLQMNMAREISRRLRAADERWFQFQLNHMMQLD